MVLVLAQLDELKPAKIRLPAPAVVPALPASNAPADAFDTTTTTPSAATASTDVDNTAPTTLTQQQHHAHHHQQQSGQDTLIPGPVAAVPAVELLSL